MLRAGDPSRDVPIAFRRKGAECALNAPWGRGGCVEVVESFTWAGPAVWAWRSTAVRTCWAARRSASRVFERSGGRRQRACRSPGVAPSRARHRHLDGGEQTSRRRWRPREGRIRHRAWRSICLLAHLRVDHRPDATLGRPAKQRGTSSASTAKFGLSRPSPRPGTPQGSPAGSDRARRSRRPGRGAPRESSGTSASSRCEGCHLNLLGVRGLADDSPRPSVSRSGVGRGEVAVAPGTSVPRSREVNPPLGEVRGCRPACRVTLTANPECPAGLPLGLEQVWHYVFGVPCWRSGAAFLWG